MRGPESRHLTSAFCHCVCGQLCTVLRGGGYSNLTGVKARGMRIVSVLLLMYEYPVRAWRPELTVISLNYSAILGYMYLLNRPA